MTKSNRTSQAKEGKAITVLAHTRNALSKKAGESEGDYQDRVLVEAYWNLRNKQHRTKQEAKEFKDLQEKYVSYSVLHRGGLSYTMADDDLKNAARRLYNELSNEHGEMSPSKHMLIDRLVSAWSMASSYERLFKIAKYKVDMNGVDANLSYTHNTNSVQLMRETRRGIEASNDQIIRLSQALRNLSSPPFQVNVRNAYIAQNQQVNQSSPPKDLEKNFQKNNEKTGS